LHVINKEYKSLKRCRNEASRYNLTILIILNFGQKSIKLKKKIYVEKDIFVKYKWDL